MGTAILSGCSVGCGVGGFLALVCCWFGLPPPCPPLFFPKNCSPGTASLLTSGTFFGPTHPQRSRFMHAARKSLSMHKHPPHLPPPTPRLCWPDSAIPEEVPWHLLCCASLLQWTQSPAGGARALALVVCIYRSCYTLQDHSTSVPARPNPV